MLKKQISRKVTETQKDKVSFTLALPPEVDPKPRWVVDLPGGHTAQIFDYEIINERSTREGYVSEKSAGFKITLHRKDGSIRADLYNIYGAGGRRVDYMALVCASPLQVRNDLMALARILMPKTRRVVVEEDDDGN